MGVFSLKGGKKNPDGTQISTITEELEALKSKDANTSSSDNNSDFVTKIKREYNAFEDNILKTLESGGIFPRPGASSGFWLGSLIGICAISTLYNSFSPTEIPLLGAITGTGLIFNSICLIIQLLISQSADVDFHILYFIPVGITSLMYFFAANKVLITSISWGMSVGSLGTWGVLQIMSKFPKRFTLGEATVITHGILLLLLSNGSTSPLREVIPPGYRHALAETVWQSGITFLGLLSMIYAVIPWIRTTFYFFFMAVVMLLIYVSPWVYFTDVKVNSTIDMIYRIMIEGRIPLNIYWAICFLTGCIIITYQTLSESHGSDAARRTFTFIAASIIIPGLIYASRLLHFVSGIMMGIFIVFEFIRYIFTSPPLDNLENGGTDKKNVSVPFSPLYCCLGVVFPMWMNIVNDNIYARLGSALTIAVGDTAARIFGSKWGKNKWPGSEKTIEGTVACILSQILCIYAIITYGYFYLMPWQFWSIDLIIIGVSLVEGLTDQTDNLVLPFLFYIGTTFICC